MTLRNIFALFFFACGLCFHGRALGQIMVYNNGIGSLRNGNNLSLGDTADDFPLNARTTLGGIRFWSLDDVSLLHYDGHFNYRVYDTDGIVPGHVIAFGSVLNPQRTATGRTQSVWPYLPEFEWSVTIAPLTLDSGTYWLRMDVGGGGSNGGPFWEWTFPNNSLYSVYELGPGIWAANGQPPPIQMSFQLFSVPEPDPLVTTSLVAICFIYCQVWRHRQGKT